MKNEIIIFEEEDIRLEVSMHDETVWLTQAQISNLFARSQSSISEHISSVFSEGELDKESNIGKTDIANSDKPVTLYSLDVIISVGYRVKSKRGTQFRRWANSILKEYLLRGYVINPPRVDYVQKTTKIKFK